MNFFKNELEFLKNISIRQHFKQGLQAGYSAFSSYMVYKVVCLFLCTNMPICVVLTQSMEPGFKREDIIFLKPKPFNCGDMVVYSVKKGAIPIVHRAIKVIGDQILTKGDNNNGDDVPLYRRGQIMLYPDDCISSVIGYIPYFGMPTIWFTSIPGLGMMMTAFVGISMYLTKC